MGLKLSLQRYNQIIWAIVGTGALVLMAWAIVCGLRYGFGHHRYQPMKIEAVDGASVKNILKNRNVHAGMPVTVAGSPYQLIPLTVDRLVISGKFFKVKRAHGAYSSHWGHGWHGGWGHEGWGPGGWGHGDVCDTPIPGNVLIRDTRNGSTRLLMAQPAVIFKMDYPHAARDGKPAGDAFPPRGTLYWEIGLADSNDDGLLNDKDAAGVYLSDADGSHMVNVTPPNSRVLARSYDAARQILTLKIATDTNGDKSLDGADKTSLVEVDVAKRKMLGVIFDDAKGQDSLKDLTQLNVLPVAQ